MYQTGRLRFMAALAALTPPIFIEEAAAESRGAATNRRQETLGLRLEHDFNSLSHFCLRYLAREVLAKRGKKTGFQAFVFLQLASTWVELTQIDYHDVANRTDSQKDGEVLDAFYVVRDGDRKS